MKNVDTHLESIRAAATRGDLEQLRELADQLIDTVEQGVAWQPAVFIETLRGCVEIFDHQRTGELCEKLRARLQTGSFPHTTKDASTILELLKRKGHFGELLKTADIFIQEGTAEPVIVRLYAQALIEAGQLAASGSVLAELEARCLELNDAAELSEARGLLGRVHKQIYLNACQQGAPTSTTRKSLQQAFRHYTREYQNDNAKLWLGVNVLALWHRANLDGVELPAHAVDDTARGIIQTVESMLTATDSATEIDLWAQASAAEASIALGDYAGALEWIRHYVSKNASLLKPDAFELASTLRQLEQVWQFDPAHPEQGRILQVLRSGLLACRGGSIDVENLAAESHSINRMLDDKNFEKILGHERFRNLQWLQTGFNKARFVCKIVDRFGDGIGTGFLLQPKDLKLPHSTPWVVLTNAHVVSSDATEMRSQPPALAPENAQIQFEASEKSDRLYNIDRILAWSPRNELDFAVLALSEDLDFPHKPMSIAKRLPAVDQNQRIYIIGHPRGGKISFSLYDNLLLDHEAPKLHYRSPTQQGSSGSPVFNQDWGLIGLHHAGGDNVKQLNGKQERYAANEGIWINSIASDIERKINDINQNLA